MEIAVRPHIVAGVALLGAGVIAVSPMAPPVPDIHLPSISTAANNLVALTSPLQLGDAYNQVLQAAIANIQGLIQNVVKNPTPILSAMAANQAANLSTLAAALQTTGSAAATTLGTQVPALLQTALGQLSATDITGAVNTLLEIPVAIAAPALGLLPALQQIITAPIINLVNVIKAVTDPVNAPLELVGLVAPLISMTGATGVAIQNVVDAMGTGDVQGIANAVLTAPATIADGLLNGGYGPDLGPLVGQPISVFAGGLLSLNDAFLGGPTGIFIKTAGPLGALLFLRQTIANALHLQPPATTEAAAAKVKTDPAAIPAASAATIALPAGEAPTDTKPATTPATGATPAADPTAPAAGTAPATAPADDTAPAKADDATATAPAATDPTATKGDEGTGTTTTPAKADDTTSTTPVKTTKPVHSTPSSTTPATDKGETTGTTPAGSTDTKSGNEAKPSTKAGNDAGKSGDGSAAGKSSDNAGGAAKSEGAGEKHDGAKHAAKHGGDK